MWGKSRWSPLRQAHCFTTGDPVGKPLCVIAPANPRLTICASVCYKARRKGGKQVDLNMDKLEDHPPTLSLWWGKEREAPVEVENMWNWRCWTEVWKEWDLGEKMVTSAWEMLRWGEVGATAQGTGSTSHWLICCSWSFRHSGSNSRMNSRQYCWLPSHQPPSKLRMPHRSPFPWWHD